MTCIEYRRRRLSGLRQERQPIDVHAEQCASCAEFDRAVTRMDMDIDNAARIQVPEELTQKILLDRCLQARRRFFRIAAAASLVVLIGGGIGATRLRPSRARLADMAVDHIIASADEVAKAAHPVAPEQVMEAFAKSGGRLRGPIGDVVFCKVCDIDGQDAQHLVVQALEGNIAVLLLPSRRLAARQETERAGYVAVVVPAGRGSLGIVARTVSAASAMEHTIRRQVVWG